MQASEVCVPQLLGHLEEVGGVFLGRALQYGQRSTRQNGPCGTAPGGDIPDARLMFMHRLCLRHALEEQGAATLDVRAEPDMFNSQENICLFVPKSLTCMMPWPRFITWRTPMSFAALAVSLTRCSIISLLPNSTPLSMLPCRVQEKRAAAGAAR